MLDSLAIMLAIVIPTILATLAVGWWFRESNGSARYHPAFVYSGRLELIARSIPALVFFLDLRGTPTLANAVMTFKHQSLMMPRFAATVTACVLSATSSLAKWP